MISYIIRSSIKHWPIVLIATAVLLFWSFKALEKTPLDAIPDLSDIQVIVFTGWAGQSPDLVEDQVTYPIVTALMGAPKVKYVRGQSFFGLSFVNVIFDEDTDLYWARSRVLEYMSGVSSKLPGGVTPELGPDATGVGWVYQYALKDTTGKRSLAELRSLQDWLIGFDLKTVPGVAEVASIGGFIKQYQVQIDPNKLRAYDISIKAVTRAIMRSNQDTGARVLEVSGTEHFIRGRGYIKSAEDLENIPIFEKHGTPVFIRQLGIVTLGSDMRRGAADLDGLGETVGGIVVMRWGGDAKKIIEDVKVRIAELQKTLPEGVEIIPVYDRSELIQKATDNLLYKLIEEVLIVSIVVALFLWHFRSALIVIIPLPVAIMFGFIPMEALNSTANIMSLSGIAIAIGAMVDASIILVENAHKKLEAWELSGKKEPRIEIIQEAMVEMGRPLFFALLVITVSFLPVFALTGQEGRLFTPLAMTKTFAMAGAALLAITLTPALSVLLLKGKIHGEEEHPISVQLRRIYLPICRKVLEYKKRTMFIALGLMASTIPVFMMLGSEFMPPLNEGTLLYMPTAVPGMSIREAVDISHRVGKAIKETPEVKHVFTKVGRAQSATDPAPLSMIEAVVTFIPEDQWRDGYDIQKIQQELDLKVQIPGMPNIWWMPIQTRTEMLATGIRSALGIKVLGSNLKTTEEAGALIEQALEKLEGTRSAFSERSTGGYFIDFEVDRAAAARFGVHVADIMEVLSVAVGGKNISTSIEGRERYPINLRYQRDFRSSIPDLEKILIPTPRGAHIPIGLMAKVVVKTGPPMIRDENGRLASFVFVDIDQSKISLGDYVEQAKALVAKEVQLPAGTTLVWAGQYTHLKRAMETFMMVIPLTLLLVMFLLYVNTGDFVETLLVMLTLPFGLIGAFWLLFLLDYNLSVAVWVGIIALAGLNAETGVVMLVYLKLSLQHRKDAGTLNTQSDFHTAIIEGAVQRIRPIMMTAFSTFIGLLPIMWAAGSGAMVMKRIAAPMVGGMLTSVALNLLVYPVIFALWQGPKLNLTKTESNQNNK